MVGLDLDGLLQPKQFYDFIRSDCLANPSFCHKFFISPLTFYPLYYGHHLRI